MAQEVRLRRGTANQHSTFTGAEGEVTVDTTNDTIRVHDGSLAGGHRLAKYSELVDAAANTYLVSTVSNIEVGDSLSISVNYANNAYPGGVFTIQKQGALAISITNRWATNNSSNKNAYTDYANSEVNEDDIELLVSLTNASFDIQSDDTITIGSTTITGSDLSGLGISGTGGIYTISASLFASSVQTNSSSSVSWELTTDRGQETGSATTLTNTQPIPFNINSITASFPSSTVPYWDLDQSFSWSLSKTSGSTVTGGTTTFTGGVGGTLTTSGATNGTSASIDSTITYTVVTDTYTGTGAYGAGTSTATDRTRTITPATKYYPLFWKTTESSSNPNFTTSDSHNSYDFALNQTAVTTDTTTDYTWIATPTSANRTFKYIFLGSDVVLTPTTTYTEQDISGETYNVYGFTNFSAATTIYVVS